MEKYSTYHIETDGFEKVLVGTLHMIQQVPLGTKCRIVLDYDPALPKATIETFIDKPDVLNGSDYPDYDFSESDFGVLENPDPTMASKLLWVFEQDKETGAVTVVPMNGDIIVIHGKQEAEMFCRSLTQCFQ